MKDCQRVRSCRMFDLTLDFVLKAAENHRNILHRVDSYDLYIQKTHKNYHVVH